MAQQTPRTEPDKDESLPDQSPEPSKQEGHGGQGSESVMRLLRLWEQRRAASRTTRDKDKPDKGS